MNRLIKMIQKEENILRKYLSNDQIIVLMQNDILHLVAMSMRAYKDEDKLVSDVSNWVAISHRKPPKEWGNYMVCLENNSIFQANYCRIGTERWLIVGVGEITNENPVLYWMEEPKPPCC
jgi:hypothetical protein